MRDSERLFLPGGVLHCLQISGFEAFQRVLPQPEQNYDLWVRP